MATTTAQIRTLAAAENHLWEITKTHGFAEIKAAKGIISGEDLVGKLDAYFADPKHSDGAHHLTDLSFLKGKDGKTDPEVAAFAKTHPGTVAGFVAYANQYLTITKDRAGMDSELADKTIAAVDGLYSDGHYAAGRFHAAQITEQVTDMHVTNAKGLGRQISEDLKIDYPVALRIAEQLLKENHIHNSHAIGAQQAIHVSEAMFNQLHGGAPLAAPAGKTHEK